MSSQRRFEELFKKEQAEIEGGPDAAVNFLVSSGEADQEPWVSHVSKDRVGVAFSGGGIRSATFSLGLLQGLFDLKVLERVDYLSTVSGGGYIGGWWTAWLARHKEDEMFPTGTGRREARDVRHLREFSNFLVPRWGLFQTEMWNAIVAVLASILPALLVALATMATVLLAGLLFLSLLFAAWNWWYPALILGVATLAAQYTTECVWYERRKCDPGNRCQRGFWIHTIAACLVTFVVSSVCEARKVEKLSDWTARLIVPENPLAEFLDPDAPVPVWPYFPVLAWLLSALMLIGIRYCERLVASRPVVASLDRVLGRLLFLALGWLLLMTLWQVGVHFSKMDEWASLAAAAVGSGTLFVTLRNWIGKALTPARTAGLWEMIKPLIPQVLAYVTVALLAVLLARLFAFSYKEGWSYFGLLLGTIVVLLLLAAFSLDPNKIGLHAFYRGRITRAYLGASNLDASDVRNRETDERDNDDIRLNQLPARPYHLVCCAGNDLSGDALETLGRGSRSVTLAKLGIASGQHWKQGIEDVTLSSALTASAAAFNSNMGSVSTRLGPAVSFLMTALNLRLGLWVENPARVRPSQKLRMMRGLLFFKEMLSWTNAKDSYIHLSDGAHFENLGLYELLRRHCRYIIVSDGGADPQAAFDDFGNALRRIRADFGVEIDIDLEPLRPGTEDGLARQHVVVGTIDYDRKHDKGVLVYFKPNLTGDEPYDVQQYKTRNTAFPNETTGDQFYDEAQWESYRRLGEHAARSAFRFVEQMPTPPRTAHAIFSAARWHWYPTPPGLEDAMIGQTARYAALEDTLRREAPAAFRRELFPELDAIAGLDTHPPRITMDELEEILGLLLQMIQIMEDAWLACRLDDYSNHPLNLGWVNLFQRWAAAPSFRMWWPVLKPLYGSNFRDFVERQLKVSAPLRTRPRIEEHTGSLDSLGGMAWQRWKQSVGQDTRFMNKSVFTCTIPLVYATERACQFFPVQVGLAAIAMDRRNQTARWSCDDFFVPPTLWGAGLGRHFLAALFQHLFDKQITRCEVELHDAATAQERKLQHTDVGSRAEHADLIDFYRGAGFVLDKPGDDLAPPTRLVRLLTAEVDRRPR